MIVEIPIESIIDTPDNTEEEEEFCEFDQELIDNWTVKRKPCEAPDDPRMHAIDQTTIMVLEDKNINFSKKPGYITLDLARQEEPRNAHSLFFDDKGDAISQDNNVPKQY